jgi:hypothetical protein
VLTPTDVIATKLTTLSERCCDFGQLLPPVRAVREELDWPRIRAETADNPLAAAFLVLAERLGDHRPGQHRRRRRHHGIGVGATCDLTLRTI